MATKKVYKKGELVTSIDNIINNKNKYFIVTFMTHIKTMSYNNIIILSLGAIIDLINHNEIYLAIVTEEQIISKTKSKVIPKVKSNITDCKANLEDIYND